MLNWNGIDHSMKMRETSRATDKKLLVNNNLGKTTTATKFPNHLIVATEKGYSAIPGAMAQPINTWGEFKKLLKELKKPAVQEKFETIIIDTADLLWGMCEKFICANATNPKGGIGVDSIKEIPYGQGFGMVEKEFDAAIRSIVQMNYGLVIISHATDKTFKDENGEEYNRIVPTLPNKARNVCSRLCDIIAYSHPFIEDDGTANVRLYLRGTPRMMAGSRFKYIAPSINFSYENLVGAIGDAIDKEMEERGAALFTDEASNLYTASEELDFDEMQQSFESTVKGLIEKDEEKFKNELAPKITQIVEKHLGKGNKVSNCSRDQVEALDLILLDLKELVG